MSEQGDAGKLGDGGVTSRNQPTHKQGSHQPVSRVTIPIKRPDLSSLYCQGGLMISEWTPGDSLMHPTSLELMRQFIRDYLPDDGAESLLDVGSQNVNGTYRPLFTGRVLRYVGLDVAPGAGVDIVVADPYDWSELRDNSFDLVISGQAMEHIERPWETVGQMSRKVRPGGTVCVIVPSCGPEHRYPVDCYRFLPDGVRALGRMNGLDELQIEYRRDADWGDVMGVFRKGAA